MNYTTLKTEVDLALYSAMTDSQIITELNVVDKVITVKVDYKDVASYLSVMGKYYAISESTDPAAKEFMLAANTFDTFDLNKPLVTITVTTLLSAMVTASLINEANKTDVLALTSRTVSRAEELGLPVIEQGHLNNARDI